MSQRPPACRGPTYRAAAEMPLAIIALSRAIGLDSNSICATVAQLVEQGIRNAQVCGSTPHGGSIGSFGVSGKSRGNPFIIVKSIS